MLTKIIPFSVAAILSIGLLGGCTDETARSMAKDAMTKAEAAQACCDATRERVDRMYQKIMSK